MKKIVFTSILPFQFLINRNYMINKQIGMYLLFQIASKNTKLDTHLKSRTPCKREQLKPQQQQNSLQFTPPSFILERGLGSYCKQGAPKHLDIAYNWVNNQSWTNPQTNSRLSMTSLFWKCQNCGCTFYCKRSDLFTFWSP